MKDALSIAQIVSIIGCIVGIIAASQWFVVGNILQKIIAIACMVGLAVCMFQMIKLNYEWKKIKNNEEND